ncbi:HEAT repeat domain-containing protein [Gemmata sp.]|uniref:HEAT repeat domain-containing protein n=1 Tax=Gemmata sp. TaxID=1914242 RepID=UPI003F6EE4C2
MFGLFAPTCPLGTAEKAWIERRMRWLAGRLGIDRMRDAPVVLPTDAFFPDNYGADEASARQCFDRVCRYMRVDPATLTLTVLPDGAMPGAAGWYQRGERSRTPVRRARANVFVAASQLANPMALIATLAHEVGHEILLGGNHLSEGTADHEQVTDLLTVFLGVGVFNANATLHESSWTDGNLSGWSVGRQGYLSAAAFGYAFGVFAYVRRETSPAWARHLRPDARGAMDKGVRYLRKTRDSLFQPDEDHGPPAPPTAAAVLEGLAHTSATFRLGALWDVPLAGATGREVIAAVCRCLRDRDGAVQFEAARTLGAFGADATAAVPHLLDLVQTESPVWSAALPALAAIGADAALVVPEIISLLRSHPADAGPLARVAKAYGAAAEPALPALLDAIGHQLSKGVGELHTALAVVRELAPDPEALIREHFASDPELRRLALWEMQHSVG